MTEEPGRTTRRFLTPPVAQVHAHLRARMQALGMTVTVDAAGNLRGVWQPEPVENKRLILGSHIDTVPDAGAFDGVLGVVLALEWVRIAQEQELNLPIEVIAFSEEEGVRYGLPFLGSRAVAGVFDLGLLAYEDAEGVRMDQAIRNFGLDPAAIPAAKLDDNVLGFVEIHIEQGPVLEAEELPLAVVTTISGQSRHVFRFHGQANHAGTTPMHLRRDALAAAAQWIGRVEDYALANRDIEGLVLTVGSLTVHPGASNVIPGDVELTLDIRCPNRFREDAAQYAIRHAEVITQRRGLTFDHALTHDQPHIRMDAALTAALAGAVESAGYPLRKLPSGAGHDAMVMAGKMPAAMLFLRSPGGISHHPAETVLTEDVEAALRVGGFFLRGMNERILL
jgi:allantoate deiminase